jgi:hypothetical protein
MCSKVIKMKICQLFLKKVLYEFNYLSVCLFIYLYIYLYIFIYIFIYIYVTCSRLGAQNQYVRVIYPSIGYFLWSKKIYTFSGRKGKNRLPEPKNGSWGPKSVWSCDMSIDQEFNIDEENIYF